MSDLIDRHEAINAVGDAIADGRSWYRALKEVTSAEKTGQWENDGHTIACSNCHIINIRGIAWDYCPNCGAKMEIHNEDIH